MAIREHPAKGSILLCNFNQGFREPEMVKRRPVIVLTPKIRNRPGLCTVVALSTTKPRPAMPYHAQIDLVDVLPEQHQSEGLWIKGDMVCAVGFHRLDFIRFGRDSEGKRRYYYATLSPEQMALVHQCVLHGMGLSALTKHL